MPPKLHGPGKETLNYPWIGELNHHHMGEEMCGDEGTVLPTERDSNRADLMGLLKKCVIFLIHVSGM